MPKKEESTDGMGSALCTRPQLVMMEIDGSRRKDGRQFRKWDNY